MEINRREMLLASAAAIASPLVGAAPVEAAAFGGESDIWQKPPGAWTAEEVAASGFGFSIPAGSTVENVTIMPGKPPHITIRITRRNHESLRDSIVRIVPGGTIDGVSAAWR